MGQKLIHSKDVNSSQISIQISKIPSKAFAIYARYFAKTYRKAKKLEKLKSF